MDLNQVKEPEEVDPWSALRTEEAQAQEGTINPVDKVYDDAIDSDSDDGQEVIFQDLQLFLDAIGEPHLVDKFIENRVTLGQLLEFNEQDLINCGIDLVGERKKIVDSIGKMHSEKWHPSSLHDLSSKSLLHSPGIYVALNDINKHMEYIGVTFKYLKRRLEERPEMLELGKDYVGVTKIYTEIEDLMKTCKSTYSQLRNLNKEVSKHMDNPSMKPANHIDEKYILTAKVRGLALKTWNVFKANRIIPGLIATVTLVATVRLLPLMRK